MGDSVERQGSNAQAKDPPTPLLSQYSERSSCLVGGRRNNCNSHRSLVL